MFGEISRKVDYLVEGIALLQHLGEGETYADLRESLSKKYANLLKEGLWKFEILEKIDQAAEEEFHKDMEEIRYYFPAEEIGITGCAGKMAILWDVSEETGYKDITELRNCLERIPESEYCRRFGNLLQGYCDIVRIENEGIKMEEPYAVISYLMKMEIKDEEKWKLQKVFFERKEHQKRVMALLERATVFLRGFEDEFEKLTEHFFGYWSKILEGQRIADYIAEKMDITISENPLGFLLCPYILWPNVVTMRTQTEEDGQYRTPDIYRIGILFGEDFDVHTGLQLVNEGSGFEDYVMQVMKLLGDKSKFEILSYIRDKEAYGSELAKHLNLTTATVSHHMNALLTAGLIEIKRVENRVYYHANKKILKEVLDYSKKILTGE